MIIPFPNVLLIDESRAKNPLRQVGELGLPREGARATFTHRRLEGFIFQPAVGSEEILIIPKSRQIPEGHVRIIQATIDAAAGAADLSDGFWLRHPLLNGCPGVTDRETEIQKVLESWAGAFSYVQEDPARNFKGLRGPQIGAVHAVHAHWAVSDAPAPLVRPTGTGKTETMLSILVSAGCLKLLVVVPTDTLRTQLALKFLTLGILKEPGCAVLQTSAKHPIVCTLQHIPRAVEEVDDIFGRSQVIVTTSHIAGQSDQAVQDRMAKH